MAACPLLFPTARVRYHEQEVARAEVPRQGAYSLSRTPLSLARRPPARDWLVCTTGICSSRLPTRSRARDALPPPGQEVRWCAARLLREVHQNRSPPPWCPGSPVEDSIMPARHYSV